MIDKGLLITLTEEFLSGSDNYLAEVKVNPGNVISIEIDNDNGVDINDCVELSRYIESKLNREEEDFELTVGSVGLTSPFKSLRQYKKYIGSEIEVLTRKGQKIFGVLKSASENEFTISISKKERLEGAKRKTEINEDLHFKYDEVKYTKYLIRFK
ncbi:MAG: ribosome assembly cofactor RimP [Dysgonamonadaceae bacterium]|nr:ribosome assembly cofactor RimP [Dysgonamonadaceae bacterium]MDD4727586.1 ribosome assembly cofactor RimP [Dysgonamonadaceae bacterium]